MTINLRFCDHCKKRIVDEANLVDVDISNRGTFRVCTSCADILASNLSYSIETTRKFVLENIPNYPENPQIRKEANENERALQV